MCVIYNPCSFPSCFLLLISFPFVFPFICYFCLFVISLFRSFISCCFLSFPCVYFLYSLLSSFFPFICFPVLISLPFLFLFPSFLLSPFLITFLFPPLSPHISHRKSQATDTVGDSVSRRALTFRGTFPPTLTSSLCSQSCFCNS